MIGKFARWLSPDSRSIVEISIWLIIAIVAIASIAAGLVYIGTLL